MRFLKHLTLAVLCVFLSGCAAGGSINKPAVTLPPASYPGDAPEGDLQGDLAAEQVFYLPSVTEDKLSPFTATVTAHPFRWSLEELTHALLTMDAPDMSSLPGHDRLSLAAANPAEVSRGIATINLSASALSLSHEELNTVCQAITNTLCRNTPVQGVNILIGNVQPGLDLGGTTPAGTLAFNTEDSLATLWNRSESRRAAVQENRRFTCDVTVYLPCKNAQGILAEMRSVTFEDPTLIGICTRLLNVLAEDTALECAVPMPDMALTLGSPISMLEPGGDKVLEINLNAALNDYLNEHDISLTLFAASAVYTLTTFVPGLTGIKITVDGERLTNLPLRESDPEGSLTVTDGILRRALFSRFLLDEMTLYMPGDTGLIQIKRAVPWYESRSPRRVFDELAAGSLPGDSLYPLPGPLPGGSSQGDLTGLMVSEDMSALCISLSGHFIGLCSGESSQKQAQILYAVINSMIDATDFRKIVIFSDSEQNDSLSGLDLRGVFLKNEDILHLP